MRELFNEEQLMVLKEIAQDQELVDRVKWWVKKEEGEHFCPMSGFTCISSVEECEKLCHRIWPILRLDLLCPCHQDCSAKEAALIIIEEASK